MYKLTALTALCLMWCLPVPAQYQPFPIVSYKGDENISQKGKADHRYERVHIPNQSIFTNTFVFEMHDVTDMYTGYDLQSNASPQQLWYDFPTGTLNAVFMTSQSTTSWPDRTCTYFYSTDAGVTWSVVGEVPPSAPLGGVVSGFPSMIGLSSGRIVISNHSALGGGATRTQLFINSAAGQNDFINYDPGTPPSGLSLWSKLGKTNNDVIVFASADNSEQLLFLNSFDPASITFSGYTTSTGREPEGYSFSTSAEGKVGFAFLDGLGGACFKETTDGGITWLQTTKIFEPFLEIVNNDTILHGTIRGINTSYIGESPKVVFEVYRRTPNLQSWYPELPSEIYFWSPAINGGNSFIIADSNNVPFYPNQGIVWVFSPIARPVIGKSDDDGALFVAFYASSEEIFNPNSTPYYVGYFMMSNDGGLIWSNPERFTPVTDPLLDWRWISIAPVNPVAEDKVKVHLAAVGDPVAGAGYPGPPSHVTAKFYHFSTEISLTNVDKETEMVSSFRLHQNYPNPFNPLTTIGYQIPDGGYITLKIFDVMGNEISTLVNEFKPAGKYKISFDASSLASGVYFYQLRTDNFIQTKKMVLIR